MLDASVALSWALADESDPVSVRAEQELRLPGGAAIVPALWWYEVRNILIVSERRGRITSELTADFLEQLKVIPITIVPPPADRVLLDLARRMKLSVYDAAYLALAVEGDLPLATLDRALRNAAQPINVPLLA